MARRFVGDGDDVYRVEVVHRRREYNYQTGLWEELGGSWTAHYGPYNTVGAARCQLTHQAYVSRFDMEPGETARTLREGVISAKVQKAHVQWEDVE